MEDTLFTLTNFKELKESGIEVTKTERITYDYKITIEDKTFDAYDLYHTLIEVGDGGVTTDFSPRKTELLKKYGILRSEGNQRWMMSATLGPNGKEFIQILEDKIFVEEDE